MVYRGCSKLGTPHLYPQQLTFCFESPAETFDENTQGSTSYFKSWQNICGFLIRSQVRIGVSKIFMQSPGSKVIFVREAVTPRTAFLRNLQIRNAMLHFCRSLMQVFVVMAILGPCTSFLCSGMLCLSTSHDRCPYSNDVQ